MARKINDSYYKVYAILNPANQKVYIGVTKNTLSHRFDNGNGYKKCLRLWDDIEKYGFDSFEKVVIRDKMERDEAMALEERLVDMLGTMDPNIGYNMRRGGIHNIPCDDVGKHISIAKIGHIVSEETRRKLSKYNRRSVVQRTMSGDYVSEYDSLTDAAKAVGSYKSNIYAVCIGKKKSCRGYRWSYAS